MTIVQRSLARKRVCHISSVHSGVEIRIVRKQLATLAQAGYDAHLVIPASDQEAAEIRAMGISITPLPRGKSTGHLARMLARGAMATRLARRTQADIYHFHDPELIPYGLALKAMGNRVVMDVHEDFAGMILHKEWIPGGIRTLVSRLTRRVELFSAARFDAVVSAVPFLDGIFKPHARRSAVVGNFPFVDELANSQIDAPWGSRQKIAYVGAVSKIRGVFELVRALPQLNVQLQLAGRFVHPPERTELIQEPGWNLVEELGFVGRSQIRDVLASSFAGLCTLYPTPFHVIAEPIKMFEYMAAGIPVISSNIPYYEQIVNQADCGICVDPTDTQQVAQAIAYLRDHPGEAQRMGSNGRRAVLDRYNWAYEGRKLVSLYGELLAN